MALLTEQLSELDGIVSEDNISIGLFYLLHDILLLFCDDEKQVTLQPNWCLCDKTEVLKLFHDNIKRH